MMLRIGDSLPDLAGYRDHLAFPFTIVTDIDRRIYHLLGAERGNTRLSARWLGMRVQVEGF